MIFKLFVCCFALFVQTALSQCLGPNYGYAAPLRPVTGCLTIANSPEPIMNIYSDDLLISGPVIVAGKLPFSGTVALEGALPAAGAGAVNYGCGANMVGIVAETPVGPNPYEYGCGCGVYY